MNLFRWYDDVNYQREALSLEVVHLILFIFFKWEIKDIHASIDKGKIKMLGKQFPLRSFVFHEAKMSYNTEHEVLVCALERGRE